MALKIDYTLRLPDGEFFPAAREKTGIAIHHTLGGTAFSTFVYWIRDRTKAATVVPLARQMKFEQRFIGIELASEGGLTEFDGKLYCFDTISPKTLKPSNEAFDYVDHYRGYRYFDKYEPAQVDRLVQLVDHICDTFSIERQVPYPTLDYFGERLADFKGIIGHAMVRRDKSDPAPDLTLWDRIITECKLRPVSIPKAPQPQAIHLSDMELDRIITVTRIPREADEYQGSQAQYELTEAGKRRVAVMRGLYRRAERRVRRLRWGRRRSAKPSRHLNQSAQHAGASRSER